MQVKMGVGLWSDMEHYKISQRIMSASARMQCTLLRPLSPISTCNTEKLGVGSGDEALVTVECTLRKKYHTYMYKQVEVQLLVSG